MAMSLNGAIGVAIVDVDSGVTLAQAGGDEHATAWLEAASKAINRPRTRRADAYA